MTFCNTVAYRGLLGREEGVGERRNMKSLFSDLKTVVEAQLSPLFTTQNSLISSYFTHEAFKVKNIMRISVFPNL